jgi:hypothetical protein
MAAREVAVTLLLPDKAAKRKSRGLGHIFSPAWRRRAPQHSRRWPPTCRGRGDRRDRIIAALNEAADNEPDEAKKGSGVRNAEF